MVTATKPQSKQVKEKIKARKNNKKTRKPDNMLNPV